MFVAQVICELKVLQIHCIYRNNPKYWDRQAFANSIDPDQTLQNVPSDQGLQYLPYKQQYLQKEAVKWTILNFRTSMVSR